MARLLVAEALLLYFGGIAFVSVYWVLRRLRRSFTQRFETLAAAARVARDEGGLEEAVIAQ